ncbi:MAG: NAD-dependent DNA ligase LigA [Lachnospiraceae bacterium]|nr:NAD-dependent DNA ligase LigA [Lachnospiraceae bacterium]
MEQRPEDLQKQKELTEKLNLAARAYYQEDREIMSNFEYDALYDELAALERRTGVVLAGSPTIQVGYEVLSELPKERHESPMLSLDKTKDPAALAVWLKDKEGLLSWKMDGLTIVLTYREGRLYKAVTRGNGEIGEVITNNARVFRNIPLAIAYPGELILRGEAVIRYSDFEKINARIEDVDAKYKNPRNLCSGTVRQLNNQITAERDVNFFAFALVTRKNPDGTDDMPFSTRLEQMNYVRSLGFETVTEKLVTAGNVEEEIRWFSSEIEHNDFPSDGLVLIYNDIAYGQSLGRTAKFPRDSIAFKWADEIRETVLREVEWSASRTGLINPIAIFDPVELEGTTVSRASLHNISIMEELELGIGDTVEVYKANMIIPQIARNLTRSGVKDIPEVCPVCGGRTEIRQENDVKSLYCTNGECIAKKIKLFTHFVSRDAMNIEGLSEATIEKLIAEGLIKEQADLFHMERFKEAIVEMEGFGEKSFANLTASIEKARKTTQARFLYSLGVPNIGLSNAKLICGQFGHDFEKVRHADAESLVEIPGVGEVIAKSFAAYFEDEQNNRIVDDLLKEITFEERKAPETDSQILAGKTFVITGSLEHYANRDALKEKIESLGGKVSGSVSAKTSWLINNDNMSNSSKNKKAKELSVPILTEEEFITMIGGMNDAD